MSGTESGATLRRRLAGMSGSERGGILEELVLEHVAAVLGHVRVSSVEPDRAFEELGLRLSWVGRIPTTRYPDESATKDFHDQYQHLAAASP